MSLSTHSKTRTVFLFRAEKPLELSLLTNLVNTEAAKLRLEKAGVKYYNCVGSWNKVEENAVIAISKDENTEDLIRNICERTKQDYYLKLTNHKHGMYKAWLVDVWTGANEFKGYFRSMPKSVIEHNSLDYTYRQDVNQYWTIWPDDITDMSKLSYKAG